MTELARLLATAASERDARAIARELAAAFGLVMNDDQARFFARKLSGLDPEEIFANQAVAVLLAMGIRSSELALRSKLYRLARRIPVTYLMDIKANYDLESATCAIKAPVVRIRVHHFRFILEPICNKNN